MMTTTSTLPAPLLADDVRKPVLLDDNEGFRRVRHPPCCGGLPRRTPLTPHHAISPEIATASSEKKLETARNTAYCPGASLPRMTTRCATTERPLIATVAAKSATESRSTLRASRLNSASAYADVKPYAPGMSATYSPGPWARDISL